MEQKSLSETSKIKESQMTPSQAAGSQRSQHSSLSNGYEIPEVFLYTTLNQNQTKDLRKAVTNRDERKILASIFNLNAIKKSPNDEINKVDELILDFHCINYDFCI